MHEGWEIRRPDSGQLQRGRSTRGQLDSHTAGGQPAVPGPAGFRCHSQDDGLPGSSALMIYRMSAAFLSLTGFFVSAYLYLYKIGRIGTLACGTGGCETVQQSAWSRFVGIEVSLIGMLGYAGLLALSLAALQPTLAQRRWPST